MLHLQFAFPLEKGELWFIRFNTWKNYDPI